MKAWRLYGPGDLRLDELPVPEVKPGWVLVKVKVVQPSVTDVEVIEGATPLLRKSLARMLERRGPAQRGHEYCGEVAEIGEGVTTLKPGDRVSSGASLYCGQCAMCRTGRTSQCLSPIRISAEIPGTFAEYVCIPEWGLVKIPEGPTDNEVATFQPLSSCVNCVRDAQINMGDTVVVLGQGPIGLGCLQISKLAGAGLLVGVDIRDENIQLAHKFGADIVIDARQTDPVEEVKRLTEGAGADIVFECAAGGAKYGLSAFKTVEQAFSMTRHSGKVIQAAVIVGEMNLDVELLQRKRVKYIFPSTGDSAESLRRAAFLVARGRIQVGPQITHVLHGLEKFPEALEITANKVKYHATNPAQIVL